MTHAEHLIEEAIAFFKTEDPVTLAAKTRLSVRKVKSYLARR